MNSKFYLRIFTFSCALFLTLSSCGKDDLEPLEPEVIVKAPSVKTLNSFDLTQTSVRIESRLVDDGDGVISSAGVCWSTNIDPTIADNVLNTDTEIGGFVLLIENLQPDTLYYIRSFAVNEFGTTYGNQIAVMTAEIPVFVGDFTISNQAALNLFTSAGFVRVEGDLIIGSDLYNYYGSSDIESLEKLSSIEEITGDLYINSNSNLANLNGFSSLKKLGGSLVVAYNDQIQDIGQFSALDSISDGLYIVGNDKLTSVDGLSKLKYIESDFYLSNNDILKNINGFGITSIGGDIEIYSNYELENIDALESLNDFDGDLSIYYNQQLNDLLGLKNITTFDNLTIYYNSDLSSLEGLDSLEEINGDLYIESNDDLTSLESLAKLTSISGSLSIYGNDTLQSLNGLEQLTFVGSSIYISYNYNLSDFCALSSEVIDLIGTGYYYGGIYGNDYNPTKDDLIAGDCSN